MLLKGHLVGQLSGRSGSVVFAHNRGGPYARDFTPPTDPESARQLLMRGAMSSASDTWALSISTFRSTWDVYGKSVTVTNRLGDPRHITGRAHFIAWFLAYTGAHNAEPVAFPVPASLSIPATPLITNLTAEIAGDTSLAWLGDHSQIDPWGDPDPEDRLSTYTSPPLADTRNFWKQYWAGYGSDDFPSNNDTPTPFIIGGGNGFDVAGGEAAFVKLHYIRRDCRLSPFVYYRVITVPEP